MSERYYTAELAHYLTRNAFYIIEVAKLFKLISMKGFVA